MPAYLICLIQSLDDQSHCRPSDSAVRSACFLYPIWNFANQAADIEFILLFGFFWFCPTVVCVFKKSALWPIATSLFQEYYTLPVLHCFSSFLRRKRIWGVVCSVLCHTIWKNLSHFTPSVESETMSSSVIGSVANGNTRHSRLVKELSSSSLLFFINNFYREIPIVSCLTLYGLLYIIVILLQPWCDHQINAHIGSKRSG